MAKLKIKIYKTDQSEPEAVVGIPLTVIRMATRFIPKKARAALQNEDINLNEIVSLAEKQEHRFS